MDSQFVREKISRINQGLLLSLFLSLLVITIIYNLNFLFITVSCFHSFLLFTASLELSRNELIVLTKVTRFIDRYIVRDILRRHSLLIALTFLKLIKHRNVNLNIFSNNLFFKNFHIFHTLISALINIWYILLFLQKILENSYQIFSFFIFKNNFSFVSNILLVLSLQLMKKMSNYFFFEKKINSEETQSRFWKCVLFHRCCSQPIIATPIANASYRHRQRW